MEWTQTKLKRASKLFDSRMVLIFSPKIGLISVLTVILTSRQSVKNLKC